MPTGVYRHKSPSKEHRKHLSESLTGHPGFWKGKKFSEEHSRKISEGQRGEGNSLYGKKHSEITKQKIRLKLTGRCISKKHKEKISQSLNGHFVSQVTKEKISGNKHPNWKGGITPIEEKIRHSEEYKKWRKDVFERDHYTCVICGKVGGYLNAHHIKSFAKYPELRFDVNNGITICLKCHYIGKKEMPLFFIERG